MDHSAARRVLVTAYLEQLGHRRIGVVVGTGEGGRAASGEHYAAIERHAAKLRDIDAVRAAVRLLIEDGATAIVAASDLAAAAALRECRALQLAVPQQMSRRGFGRRDLARCADP